VLVVGGYLFGGIAFPTFGAMGDDIFEGNGRVLGVDLD
jgi:hypothetical protein